ncbi:unnamed protein product [Schistocephalus solidus]|uniref:DDE_Tnp_1_7 domain-containing protein n=1 Tax=Schistocephalus solidus TaxID=70667 RepID=A0A183TB95_SCHSO|nr:unnamed protein product [Schistocephalus solidus]
MLISRSFLALTIAPSDSEPLRGLVNRLDEQVVALRGEKYYQVPVPRLELHPARLLPHRKAKEGISQDEAVLCADSQEKQAIIIEALVIMGALHSSPCGMDDWMTHKAEEIQGYVKGIKWKNFHAAIKTVYGPTAKRATALLSTDGTTLFTVIAMSAMTYPCAMHSLERAPSPLRPLIFLFPSNPEMRYKNMILCKSNKANTPLA